MQPPAPPPEVARALDAFPKAVRARLMDIRRLIFAAAQATGTAPLTETLKWGQPAFLPEPKRAGTTLRLGMAGEDCAIFVHCQTDIVARCRLQFGDAFAYQNNRAVRVASTGRFAEAAVQQIAAMALTYHRAKAHPRAEPLRARPRAARSGNQSSTGSG